MEKRYLIIADARGLLRVGVNEDFNPRPGESVLYSAGTVDEAFDWKEDMETRIARTRDRHCATCEE